VSLLELSGVRAGYTSASQVLHGIDLTVTDQGVTALLGANGAGKSTTLRTISGMLRRTGSIRFDGTELVGLSTDRIARLGVAHVPEGRGTFTRLTTADNLLVGALLRKDRTQVAADLDRVYGLFPRLAERRTSLAGNLSGGEQQMLAIGRALMSRPRLLLLDEPSLGLAPKVTREVFDAVGALRGEWGVSILVVEQNAALALAIADHALVIAAGRVVVQGTAEELVGHDEIRRAYLGS
jgi:branched-chain amino acid transport system ATP-binding protein